ncbi:glycine betaine ABC transporter substrate-binding protein [Allokutzneria sp. A3M-2-11 16]|uniref:glycine betaine ABC transporter substrate-binding protein n=1 Tax=Allokutzneria sp. A3M-2-11 16 TaxID=2962043 RepID=UPI0020B78259|nr:glycine betaine ABC transporter substrate-binding protein [Allokutzneria sp. A3M-2-11 16]MCP3803657.1 glycine betaine ABC transporter substrate-binding protein [Allokutzneria sp. A3M-2-11 16]
MRQRLRLSIVVVLAASVLSGCVLGQAPGSVAHPGSLAERGSLAGASITVGSKEFTEQLVLCEITAKALESVGAKVTRSCGMSGTGSVRSALLSGDIDMYWEYTGTGWVTHLGKTTPIADPRAQFEAVARGDLEANGVRWLDPAPANNTYAIAVSKEKAAELRVRTISDYAALARADPAKVSFCAAAEFFGRDDGWPGLERSYGFVLPRAQKAELALGAVPNSIDTANPCTFGEVFATDGRIEALGLTVLDDDKKHFTPFNPSLTVRRQVAEKHPALAAIMAPITQAVDDATMRKLNAGVDVEGLTEEEVAHDWLVRKGFIR